MNQTTKKKPESLEPAKPAEPKSLRPKAKSPSASTAEPAAPTSKLDKLEQEQHRQDAKLNQINAALDKVDILLGKILTEKQKPPQPQTVSGSNPAGPLSGLSQYVTPETVQNIIKAGTQLFSEPPQPQQDPMMQAMYDSFKDSYVQSFKNFIESINTERAIGKWVLEQIKQGKFKMEGAQ